MKRLLKLFALVALPVVSLPLVACSNDADSNATTGDVASGDSLSGASASATAPAPVAVTSNDTTALALAGADTLKSAAPAPPAAQANAASPGAASNAEDGARILKRTATKYDGVKSMRANFAMRVENTLLKSSASSAGRIYQKRPDKVALRFTNPAGDLIVGDGRYFWVYTPSSLPKDQVLRTPVSAGANVVDLQAQFVGDPLKRFNYTMQGTEKVGGRTADVMTLVPRDAAQYKSLKVWIDRDDALVRRFDIVEQSGVIRHLVLTNLQVNTAIDPSIFRYSPPAGVRIVGQ